MSPKPSAPVVVPSRTRYARYAGATACVICGVYWWRWWQQSKLKRAATSSSMAIEELAFVWLAFSGSLRKFMTNSVESNVKALPTEVARVLDLLRHPSITGFATRVGEGFATGIANSMRSSDDARRKSGAAASTSGAGAEAGGSILERFFSKSPKRNINAVLAPQKIENDGWKGIVEVLVMSLSTDKGKELAVSVTKAFSKELMRSWLEKDGAASGATGVAGADRVDGKMHGQSLHQRSRSGKLGPLPAVSVLRDASNLQVYRDGATPLQLKGHVSSNRVFSSANFAMCSSTPDEATSGGPGAGGGGGGGGRQQLTLPMLAIELATTEGGKQLILDIVETFTKSAIGAYQTEQAKSTVYDDILDSVSRPEHTSVVKSLATSITREAVESYVRSNREAIASRGSEGDASTTTGGAPAAGSRASGGRPMFVVPRWLAATWDIAKTAEGRTFMYGVVGSACRESVLAMMESVGLRLPSARVVDVNEDKARAGPTIVEMSPPNGVGGVGDADRGVDGNLCPANECETSQSAGPALLVLHAYKAKSVQASLFFLASLLVAVALYYYVKTCVGSSMWMQVLAETRFS